MTSRQASLSIRKEIATMAKKKDATFLEVTADFLEILSLYLRIVDERVKAQEKNA